MHGAVVPRQPTKGFQFLLHENNNDIKKKLYFNRGEGGNLAFYGDKTRYKPLPPLLGKGKQKTLENMGKILNGIWVTGT